MAHHEMVAEDSNAAEVLFVCPTCDRRLVLKLSGGLVVIDEGDFYATHSGSTSPDLTIGPVRLS